MVPAAQACMVRVPVPAARGPVARVPVARVPMVHTVVRPALAARLKQVSGSILSACRVLLMAPWPVIKVVAWARQSPLRKDRFQAHMRHPEHSKPLRLAVVEAVVVVGLHKPDLRKQLEGQERSEEMSLPAHPRTCTCQDNLFAPRLPHTSPLPAVALEPPRCHRTPSILLGGAAQREQFVDPLCGWHVAIRWHSHNSGRTRGHERRGRGRGRDGTSHAAHLKDTQDSRRRSHAGETGAQNGKRKPRGRAHRATRHARAYALLARPPIAASALSALSSIRISSRHPGSARACARSRKARPTSSRSALHLARRRRTRRRGRAGWHVSVHSMFMFRLRASR